MAWQARLTSAITPSGDKVTASFEFFDDVAPSTILWTEVFAFDPSWSNSDMQVKVRTRGAQLRAAKVRADALAIAFPTGTVIAIP